MGLEGVKETLNTVPSTWIMSGCLLLRFSVAFVWLLWCLVNVLSCVSWPLCPVTLNCALQTLFQPCHSSQPDSAERVKELVPGCRGWLSLEPGVNGMVPFNPLGLHGGEGQLWLLGKAAWLKWCKLNSRDMSSHCSQWLSSVAVEDSYLTLNAVLYCSFGWDFWWLCACKWNIPYNQRLSWCLLLLSKEVQPGASSAEENFVVEIYWILQCLMHFFKI